MFTTIRASRGQDIYAACGLLSTSKKIGEIRQHENEQLSAALCCLALTLVGCDGMGGRKLRKHRAALTRWVPEGDSDSIVTDDDGRYAAFANSPNRCSALYR